MSSKQPIPKEELMKRILSVFLALSLLLGLTACTAAPKPEDTLKQFFEAMKGFDFEGMQACMDDAFNQDDILGDFAEDDLTGLLDYVKNNAASISYQIGTPQIKDDTATVAVSAEYTDISPVMQEAFSDYFMSVLSMLFTELSEEDSEQIFAKSLSKAIETANPSRASEEIAFTLTRTDEQWKITDFSQDALTTVLTGNMMNALEDMLGDAFSEEDGWTIAAEPEDYPISDVLLIDNEQVRMTVVSGGRDEYGDFTFKIYCENKTKDAKLNFSIDGAIVNGWMANTYLYEQVSPGKNVTADLDIYSNTLKLQGIESADKVELLVQVFDPQQWGDDFYLVNEVFTIYPTGLSERDIVVPARPTAANESVIADNQYLTMIVLDEDPENFWGYALNVYVKNKSTQDLQIDWDGVSVNGSMCNPYWGIFLPAGQQIISTVSFSDQDFKNNGITSVREIELDLNASVADPWEKLCCEHIVFQP